MADFNFYLNRQGVPGKQGEKGEQGFSPIITVASDTLSEYILRIQTENNIILTSNLREHKEDLGGTYLRYDRTRGVMYIGEPVFGDENNFGVVRFASSQDIADLDDTVATTPKNVSDMIESEGYGNRFAVLEGRVDAVEVSLDVLEYSVGNLATRVTTNEGNIASLASRITTAEGSITSLGNRLTTAESGITTNANNITSLTSRVATNENNISGLTTRMATAENNISNNSSDIDNIEALIPSQATSSNQLADKAFVNSSIATNTANFIGTFNSVAELEAYSGILTNNDYAFVQTTDAAGNTLYDRYKYSTATTPAAWQFEYELNNSSFTAAQFAALNSGATSTNIAQISTNTSDIASLATRVSTAESNISLAQGDIATNTNNISTNTSNISTLQSAMTTAQSNINSLQSAMSDKLEADDLSGLILAGSNITITEDSTTHALTISGQQAGTTYTAGEGIDITNDVISVDTTVIATQDDLNKKQDVLSFQEPIINRVVTDQLDNITLYGNDKFYVTPPSYSYNYPTNSWATYDIANSSLLTIGANTGILDNTHIKSNIKYIDDNTSAVIIAGNYQTGTNSTQPAHYFPCLGNIDASGVFKPMLYVGYNGSRGLRVQGSSTPVGINTSGGSSGQGWALTKYQNPSIVIGIASGVAYNSTTENYSAIQISNNNGNLRVKLIKYDSSMTIQWTQEYTTNSISWEDFKANCNTVLYGGYYRQAYPIPINRVGLFDNENFANANQLWSVASVTTTSYVQLKYGTGLAVDANGNLINTNPTTPSVMTGADGTNAGTSGLVPAPLATDNTKYLRGDGTFATPQDTTYSVMTGATSSTAGISGLVPAPAAGDNEKFLSGDGTYKAVSGGSSYEAGYGINIGNKQLYAYSTSDAQTLPAYVYTDFVIDTFTDHTAVPITFYDNMGEVISGTYTYSNYTDMFSEITISDGEGVFEANLWRASAQDTTSSTQVISGAYTAGDGINVSNTAEISAERYLAGENITISDISMYELTEGMSGTLLGYGDLYSLVLPANMTTSSELYYKVKNRDGIVTGFKKATDLTINSITQQTYAYAISVTRANVGTNTFYGSLGTPTPDTIKKVVSASVPTVGDGIITFTQGGVTKGTITANQSGNTTIALDAGSSVTVDQAYNATSTNAQSGTAVAGAIANKVAGTGISSIVALTQSEYDALSSKSSTTLYVITDSSEPETVSVALASEVNLTTGSATVTVEDITETNA